VESLRQKRPRALDVVLIGFIGAAAVIFFWEPIVAGGCHFPWDIVDQMYPFQRFVSDSLHQGVFPLWNPYSLAGYPVVGDPQASLFYPPTLLSMFAPGAFPLRLKTVELVLVLHVILAGVGTYLLSRELGVGRLGALAAALVFMFGGFLPIHVEHETWVKAVAWIPLVFLAFHRALRTAKLGPTLGAGMLLGLSLLTGHTQTSVYTVYLLLLHCLHECLPHIATRHYRQVLRRFALLFLIVMIGLGISAVQVLPAFEYLRHTTRGQHDYSQELVPGIGSLDLVTILLPGAFGVSKSLPAGSPYLGGEPTNHLYLGLSTVALALASWWSRNEHKRFFLILAALATFLAFGSNFPAYRIYMSFVPFLKLFRRPLGFYPFTVFATAMLAGIGTDVLGRLDCGRHVKTVVRFFAVLGVLYFMLSLLASTALHFMQFLDEIPSAASLSKIGMPLQYLNVAALDSLWVVAVTAILMTAVLVRSPDIRRGARLALVCFVLVDLCLANADQMFNCTAADPDLVVYEEGAYGDALPGIDIIASDRLLGEWRVAIGPYHGAWDNVANVVRMETMNGYNPLILRTYAEFCSAIDDLDSPLLDMANVRYVVTNERFSQSAKTTTFEQRRQVFQGSRVSLLEGQSDLTSLHLVDAALYGWYSLYERPKVLPRFIGVNHSTVIPDGDLRLEALRDPGYDPSQLVILEEPIDRDLTGWLKAADLNSYSPNGFSVSAEVVGGSTMLVMSEVFYPGWEAYVDGLRTRIHRVNHTFRGVCLAPGLHEVVLAFSPASLKVGSVISVATVALVLGTLVWQVCRRPSWSVLFAVDRSIQTRRHA
jgi:hypothetical protein